MDKHASLLHKAHNKSYSTRLGVQCNGLNWASLDKWDLTDNGFNYTREKIQHRPLRTLNDGAKQNKV